MKNINTLERTEILEMIPLKYYNNIGYEFFENYSIPEIGNMLKRMIHLKEIENDALEKNIDMIEYNFDSIDFLNEIEDQNHFYELLDYQYFIRARALENIRCEEKRFIIHMPTGTGKTKTTSHIVSEYINTKENAKVLWVAHESILLEQGFNEFSFTWSKLKRKKLKINFETKNEILENDNIIFITYQKLNIYFKNKIKLNADLIVADECHKSIAETYSNGLEFAMNDQTILIGLSATPGRTLDENNENIRLSNYYHYNKISFDIDTIKDFSLQPYKSDRIIDYLVEREILSKPIFKKIGYHVSEEEVNMLENDVKINKKLTSLKNRNLIITKECINEVKKGKKIMLFAATINHANTLKMMLEINNIRTSIVYGTLGVKKIKYEMEQFKNFNSKILIVVDKLTTGFDDPKIDCIYIARNTKSLILFSQMVGRGLRGKIMGGTSKCTIYSDREIKLFEDLNDVFGFYDDNF